MGLSSASMTTSTWCWRTSQNSAYCVVIARGASPAIFAVADPGDDREQRRWGEGGRDTRSFLLCEVRGGVR